MYMTRLTVEVPGPKTAFKDVTGGFRAGKVTAIMGPSGKALQTNFLHEYGRLFMSFNAVCCENIGCGKTTLISVLSNRMSMGSSLKGDVFINGHHDEVHITEVNQ